MELSTKILSDITVWMKYAKHLPTAQRRETWDELTTRNRDMHIRKYPALEQEIRDAYEFVYARQVLPSMRSMQFGGRPVELNPARMYNCSYLPITAPECFSEIMFLLLSGCGVGYSVQRHHVEQLPELRKPRKTRRYLVGDSIEGWADAVKVLVRAYFSGKPRPVFDFSDIRPKGAVLVTAGGKAPGPEPLSECLFKIQQVFDRKQDGEKLSSVEVHDINCFIADAVLSGGIRRSAMIALFDLDDEDMLSAKAFRELEVNPQRHRANNSAVILRHKIDQGTFQDLWSRIRASNAGEPGVFFSNDKELGMNPCKPLRSLILTDEGYITFEQAMARESLRVLRPDGTVVTATRPYLTGKDRVVARIKLSNGAFLYGTENHQHQLRSGEWRRVDELVVGDRLAFAALPVHPATVSDTAAYEEGVLHGWIVADGWNYPRTSEGSSSSRAGLSIGINEFDVTPLLERLVGAPAVPHSQKPTTARVIPIRQDRLDPAFSKRSFDWVRLKSSSFKLGFLRAVFTADGSVRKNNNCELYAVDRGFLETVQTLLAEFGVRSTVTIHNYAKSYTACDGKERNNQDCWKLNVYAGQFKRIGMLSARKADLLEKQTEEALYRRADYETVVDIDLEWSVEDVYDITVFDESHAFYDTGVVTHNCAEISLRPHGFCNLTTINTSDVHDQATLNTRARAAAFIGTLQASYTDFHYLRDVWKRTAEKEALLGVSMTGIASGGVLSLNLEEAASIVMEENARVAQLVGINPAARATTVKPEGTTSLTVGSSSGIHAWHAKYYIRRLRVGKNEAIYQYLAQHHPEMVVDDYYKPSTSAIIEVPQKAPDGAITREESAMDLLHRVSHVWRTWVKPGHRKGANYNNVSTTVTIKPDEWDAVGAWMWDNRENFTALSVLPEDGGSYVQAPFEDITEDEYLRRMQQLVHVDLTQVLEITDNTAQAENLACGGGACTI